MITVPPNYHVIDIRNNLTWYKHETRADYYIVCKGKKHVFDLFKGKSGLWFATYDRGFLKGRDAYWIGMLASGIYLYKNN